MVETSNPKAAAFCPTSDGSRVAKAETENSVSDKERFSSVSAGSIGAQVRTLLHVRMTYFVGY